MDQQTINHLMALLASGSNVIDPAFLNNLVYYTPRLQSTLQLASLIRAIFGSPSLSRMTPDRVYQMAQGIAFWKLEISEPSIPIAVFYDIWNACFQKCESWNVARMAILGGILSTREKYDELQSAYFVDETGRVKLYYRNWRATYFVPILAQFFTMPDKCVDSLIAIYSTISEQEDGSCFSTNDWDRITHSLYRLFSSYIFVHDGQDLLIKQDFNKIALTLQISTLRNSRSALESLLSRLCSDCYDFSIMASKMPPKAEFNGKYYSHILFTITLMLEGILENSKPIKLSWYYQIAICLFYVNFIADEIGIKGFDSYEVVYEITTTAVANADDYHLYYSLLDTMNGNIWHSSTKRNTVNTAKLLFLLNFMGATLSQISVVTPQLINEVIMPLNSRYMNSTNQEIRESTHVLMISLFMNPNSMILTEWQAHHYLSYMRTSLDQFVNLQITEKQILLIIQKVSSRIPYLRVVEKHLLRDTLHYTYVKIINCDCRSLDLQKTLLKCLILQIPYLHQSYIFQWLETCQELLTDIRFTSEQRDDILLTLWDKISSIKSDAVLKWWYDHIVPSRPKL